MSEADILKALECCSDTNTGACLKCKYYFLRIEEDGKICIHKVCGDAAELIKKQKAEIERLSVINKLNESDIANHDKMLEQKVEVVYADFMRDYRCMKEELEGLYDECSKERKERERLEAYNENLKTANAHVLGTLQDEIENARVSARDELASALLDRVRGIYLDESTLAEIIDELKEDLE